MRLGRLRLPEVLMLPLGGALVWLVFVPTWFSAGGGEHFDDPDWHPGEVFRGIDSGLPGWLTLAVAALGLTAALQTVFRSSPAGRLASEVALTVICPIGMLVVLISYFEHGPFVGVHAQSKIEVRYAWVGIAAMWLLAIWGLRSESRGFSPDPGAAVIDMPPVGQMPLSDDG